jgi:hypothetical protein
MGKISASIASKRTLTEADLEQVIGWADRYKPKDQYDEGFDASAIDGKPFSFTIGPLAEQDSLWRGNLIVRLYDQESHQFKVSVFPDTYVLAGGGNNSFSTYISDEQRGSYVGENAFGVKMTVERVHHLVHGISENQPYSLDRLSEPKRTSWGIDVSPEVARTISPNITIQVLGRVHKRAESPLVECRDSTSAPTLSAPTETTVRACTLSVEIKEINLLGVPAGAKVVHLLD